MEAASREQYRAFADHRVPDVEKVADGVWSLPVPFPMRLSLTSTLCYLIEDDAGGLHLFDAGSAQREGAAAMARLIERTGHTLDRLRTVTVSHMHTDHVGLADALRRATGAPLLMPRREVEAIRRTGAVMATIDRATLDGWGVPEERREEILTLNSVARAEILVPPDVLLDDGDVLPIPGRSFRVLLTPGHTGGSLSLVDEEDRLVLTADSLLPSIHPGLGLGAVAGNPVAEHLATMDRLAALAHEGADDYLVCPGHDYRFLGLAERATDTALHHLRRTRGTAEVLDARPEIPLWELASRLYWAAGFDNLRGFYLASALRQTVMHADFVRSGAADPFLVDGFPLRDRGSRA